MKGISRKEKEKEKTTAGSPGSIDSLIDTFILVQISL